MVHYCCAYACKEKSSKGIPVTFHSFPKDEERRKLWESKLRRENFRVTNSSKICSKHFEPDCFDTEKFGGTWLKKTAVPTRFDFPEHLQPKEKVERSSSRKRHESEVESLSEPGPSSKKRKFYIGDFQENDMASPTKACHVLNMAKNQNESNRRKMKILTDKNRRLQKKVASLKEILKEIKKKALISQSASDILELSLPGPTAELLKRVRKNQTGTTKYCPELRSFALTLHFYSPKAYRYVRKMFNTCLPHPSTIKKWYQSVDGSSAGFTPASLNAIKIKVKEAIERNKPLPVCGLIMDEISIRNHLEWDGHKYSGLIDFGSGLDHLYDSEDLPVANQALVLMLNCLNGSWKVPIGYFFINGLNAEERANVIKRGLEFVDESGIEVVSLTFDGTSVNLATARLLGANLEIANLQPTFPHPITKKDVYVFLDPSHMLKLVRNTLGQKKSIWHPIDGFIDWNFIIKLEALQKKQGLLAATKLKNAHIEWHRQKMKVRLAAQTLSASVADALEYCEKDLKHPDFEGAEATAKFVRLFNNLFDLLNSRNLLGRGFKRPFSKKTEEEFSSFMKNAEEYIESLRTGPNGEAILDSYKKTGFLGFCICLHSVSALYTRLTKGPNPVMDFLMTYKVSQDHLEMFFSAVRSKGGYNNNPTCKQFQAAYVRLLCHVEIVSGGNENCIAIDDSSILNISSAANVYSKSINAVNMEEEDGEYMPEDAGLTGVKWNLYISDVSSYIAGYVCRKLCRTVTCPPCASVLVKGRPNPQIDCPSENKCLLTCRKDRGGLIYPSDDVVKICHVAEKQIIVRQASGKILEKNVISKILLSALQSLNSSYSEGVFNYLNKHIEEHDFMNNHKILLIKSIIFEYSKIRLHHIGKEKTQELQKNKCRSINTKTTIFKGQ